MLFMLLISRSCGHAVLDEERKSRRQKRRNAGKDIQCNKPSFSFYFPCCLGIEETRVNWL